MRQAKRLLIYCTDKELLDDWRLSLRYHRHSANRGLTQLFCHSDLPAALQSIRKDDPHGCLLLRPSIRDMPVIRTLGDARCLVVEKAEGVLSPFLNEPGLSVFREGCSRYYIVEALKTVLVSKSGPRPGSKRRHHEKIAVAEAHYAAA